MSTWRGKKGVGRSLGMVLIVLGAIGATAPAAVAAGTGGYPYAHYHGPGTRPAAYEWTDSHGNAISPYGYYFRNCTDFAAWKLATTNKFGDYRGLHNGGEWGAYARERHYKVNMSPKPGSIAWWSPSGGLGKWGHVAWVQAVKGNSVTIQEYNYRVPSHPGTWDRRTIARTAVSGYIHFKDLKGGSSSSDNPVGHFDKVGSPAIGEVRVAGRAYDPNAKTKPISIHVYVGGKAHGKGTKLYSIGKTSGMRFDKTFRTSKSGRQSVCVYAVNIGPGSTTLLGCKRVSIKSKPQTFARPTVNGTYIPISGDFNGDGRSDVFWYGPGDSHDSLWYGRSNEGEFRTAVPVTVKGTYIPISGDFNGDGRSDVFWYGPGGDRDSLWYGQSGLGAFDRPR